MYRYLLILLLICACEDPSITASIEYPSPDMTQATLQTPDTGLTEDFSHVNHDQLVDMRQIDGVTDQTLADMWVADADSTDISMIDLNPPDMSTPDMQTAIVNRWLESCQMASTDLQNIEGDYDTQQEVMRWSIGSPLQGKSLLTANFNDRDVDQITYFILHGGRVERIEAQGQNVWRSELSGLITLYGLWDFNADGISEVLVGSTTQLFLLSSIQGRVLWQSDALPIPNIDSFSGIGKVLVIEDTGNLYPSLYLADSGCSAAGTGYGVVYHFTQNWNDISAVAISTPRVAGRCAQWHSALFSSDLSSESSSPIIHDRFQRQANSLQKGSIIVTDRNGLHEFDAYSGQRVACGHIPHMPAAGALPYRLSTYQGKSAWIAMTETELMLLTIQDRDMNDPRIHCEAEPQQITPQWRISIPEAQSMGSRLIDLNQDQTMDLLLSVKTYDTTQASEYWHTWLIDGATGEKVGSIPYALLGSYMLNPQRMALLMHMNPDITSQPYTQAGSLQLFALDLTQSDTWWTQEDDQFTFPITPLWSDPVESAWGVYQKTPPQTDTNHWRNLKIFDGMLGTRILLKQNLPQQDNITLLAMDALGIQGELSFDHTIGSYDTTCSYAGQCNKPDRFTISFDDGVIRSYKIDDLLQPILPNQSVLRPTGTLSNTWYLDQSTQSSYLTTLTQSGALSVYPVASGYEWQQPQSLWTQQVKKPSRRAPRVPYAPIISKVNTEEQITVSVRDYTDREQLTWRGFNLMTGDLIWQHQLPASDWITLPPDVHWEKEDQTIIYRLERLETPQALLDLRQAEAQQEGTACIQEWVYPEEVELFTPFTACPNRPVRPRVIHALHAATGQCLWRTIIRANYDCLGPSMQVLSLTDGNDPADPENKDLYLTSTNTIRRLNATSGELQSTQLIPPPPTGSSFAGGWVTRTTNSLIRYGGNGPPDAYSVVDSLTPYLALDNTLLWRMPPIDGLRNQSWLTRTAVSMGEQLWTTLGVSLPLVRIQLGEVIQAFKAELNEEGTGLIHVNHDDLLQSTPNILSLTKHADQRISIGTAEGQLFILNAAGEFMWSRSYQGVPNAPSFVDWDQDAQMEWSISTSRGQVIFYNQSEYQAPRQVWEGDCEQASTCQIQEDIDESLNDQQICFAWRTLVGLQGAEAQLELMNGTVILPWQLIDMSGLGAFDSLDLVVGQTYRVAIRGWLEQGGNRFYTQIAYSDGVLIIDDVAPQITLQADRNRISMSEIDDQPLTLQVNMEDDQQLAGWSVVIYDMSGRLIRLLGSGSLQSSRDIRVLEWNARDLFQNRVSIGEYLILASVTDEGGNQSNTQLIIEVGP